MEDTNTDILIIGAGPAGLAAAMELSRAGKKFIVVEKARAVGGLSKTMEFREGDLTFRTDTGPHRFFSKNPYLYEFIGGLIGEKWITVKRHTRQYIGGKFYDYPINALQAFRNIGLPLTLRILLDFAISKIRYGLLGKPVNNFADYAYANFGRTLGDFNIVNYTEKIWGMPANEIHIDWAKQRIKGLDLISMAKNAVAHIFNKRVRNSPKTLVDTFYYPEYGTGLIYETIRAKLEKMGYPILLDTEPIAVNHRDGSVTSVVCRSGKKTFTIRCNKLIESVHLKSFLSLLEPKPPSEIIDMQADLKYRNQVYLFVTLDLPQVTRDQWIYFPEKSIKIGRLSEMRNFSEKMSPPGKTSLFLEFFCSEGDEIWNMTADKLFDLAIRELESMNFCRRSDVRKYYLLREEKVYPIYDVGYEKYVERIKSYLDKFRNLYYIGRPGRFRYNNQDHSLEMGMLAARSIVENKKYDLDSVGNENEYYEKGRVYIGNKS